MVEAVKFLNENAFATPAWAIDKEILRRIEPIGALNRVRNAQNSVLNNLLSSSRFARLVEQQALDGSSAYLPAEFLADVRAGVWTELGTPRVTIDASFAAMFVTSGNEKAFYRAELRAINSSAVAALSKTTDRATRVHLEGVRDQIAKILNPDQGTNTTATGSSNRLAMELIDLYLEPASCWQDHIIKP